MFKFFLTLTLTVYIRLKCSLFYFAQCSLPILQGIFYPRCLLVYLFYALISEYIETLNCVNFNKNWLKWRCSKPFDQ